ncbi:MAG: D-2-hydroxyacid dehydrogenase [Bacteroidota bacterium]
MNIVILDGYAANDGDLNWAAFERLGQLTVYPRTPHDAIMARSVEAEALITNKTPIGADLIQQLPKLRYLGLLATGYNVVDVEAAKARNIPVCNAAGYGTNSVAQHTFALLLGLCNQTAIHDQSVHRGEWVQAPDWTYRKAPMVELAGKTLGIIGLGAIGQQVANIGMAMGMEVIAYNRSPRQIPDVSMAPLEVVFRRSDVLSLHCPLTAENARFVNQPRLSWMKKGAYLLNTARGGLIDESALAQALHSGQLAGAGLDVLSTEPPRTNNPLLSAPNCLITPHNAWGSQEARQRLIDIAAGNLQAFLSGNPRNNVWAT